MGLDKSIFDIPEDTKPKKNTKKNIANDDQSELLEGLLTKLIEKKEEKPKQKRAPRNMSDENKEKMKAILAEGRKKSLESRKNNSALKKVEKAKEVLQKHQPKQQSKQEPKQEPKQDINNVELLNIIKHQNDIINSYKTPQQVSKQEVPKETPKPEPPKQEIKKNISCLDKWKDIL